MDLRENELENGGLLSVAKVVGGGGSCWAPYHTASWARGCAAGGLVR